jgi:hypothetical protein
VKINRALCLVSCFVAYSTVYLSITSQKISLDHFVYLSYSLPHPRAARKRHNHNDNYFYMLVRVYQGTCNPEVARQLLTTSQGTIHSGQPKGTVEPLHDLDVYMIGNRTSPRATIVIYSDIFGLLLPNNKLIADAYAASGEYLILLPDFFKGDPVGLKVADALLPVDATKQSTFAKYTGMLASMPTFLMWMTRHGKEKSEKDCVEFLHKLRCATPADRKIGMVGFCWGGKYAISWSEGTHDRYPGREETAR